MRYPQLRLLVSGVFLLGLCPLVAFGEDKPKENPVAEQFRKHMEAADADKDGFVTREELTAEVAKAGTRSPQEVKGIVDNMMGEFDTDKDNKLSAAEIAVGAHKTAERSNTKTNVRRAQAVMEAMGDYQKAHGGKIPAKLEDLADLVPPTALQSILADGTEKPWCYTKDGEGDNAIVIFSPGAVDSQGQYIVGLKDRRVLGMQDKDLALEMHSGLKMNVYPADASKKTAPPRPQP